MSTEQCHWTEDDEGQLWCETHDEYESQCTRNLRASLESQLREAEDEIEAHRRGKCGIEAAREALGDLLCDRCVHGGKCLMPGICDRVRAALQSPAAPTPEPWQTMKATDATNSTVCRACGMCNCACVAAPTTKEEADR